MIPKPEQFMDEANRAALCCWMETKQSMIDAGLLESVSNRIAAWMATSAEMSNNAEFYRGIVVKVGEQFGKAARTSDDGSIQDSVLALKVPELVAGLFKALEIANRSADEQMWQKREAQAAAESARASEMALRQSLDLLAKDMEKLQGLLDRARDEMWAPDPNCSCHISPPCSDCVDHSGIRELMKEIDAARKP